MGTDIVDAENPGPVCVFANFDGADRCRSRAADEFFDCRNSQTKHMQQQEGRPTTEGRLDPGSKPIRAAYRF